MIKEKRGKRKHIDARTYIQRERGERETNGHPQVIKGQGRKRGAYKHTHTYREKRKKQSGRHTYRQTNTHVHILKRERRIKGQTDSYTYSRRGKRKDIQTYTTKREEGKQTGERTDIHTHTYTHKKARNRKE